MWGKNEKEKTNSTPNTKLPRPITRKQRWNIKRGFKVLSRTFETKTNWEYG